MMRKPQRILASLCTLVLVLAHAPARAQPPEDTARARHLLERATFGVRAQDLDTVLAIGEAAWLDRQLAPAADRGLDQRLAAFPAIARPMHEAAAEEGAVPPRRLIAELATVRLVRAVHTQRQLEEVMADFWLNHFHVFFGKGPVRFMIADYERTAIRQHVFGRFEDMLLATARHPAMLFYLDNWTSVAADSMRPVSRRTVPARRQRGLNENYARELMELHTLGVDGGYTQQDVIDVARALTGWTFVPLRAPANAPRLARLEPGTFFFNAAMHDRGAKHILGRRFESGGEEEGEAVIRMLAREPATARFLATKLIAHFVSDEPDPAFVEELAEVWLRTNGDLRAVTRALFTSPNFYDPAVRGAKIKTPFRLVASTLRATGAEARLSRGLIGTLNAMGHLPWSESAPTGFPVTREDWVNSAAMLARMNFALAFAEGRIDNVAPSPQLVALTDVARLLRAVLPGEDASALGTIIVADPGSAQNPARALGLVLGSPEFQRHE